MIRIAFWVCDWAVCAHAHALCVLQKSTTVAIPLCCWLYTEKRSIQHLSWLIITSRLRKFVRNLSWHCRFLVPEGYFFCGKIAREKVCVGSGCISWTETCCYLDLRLDCVQVPSSEISVSCLTTWTSCLSFVCVDFLSYPRVFLWICRYWKTNTCSGVYYRKLVNTEDYVHSQQVCNM